MRKNLYWFFLTLIFVLSMAMTYMGAASSASPVIRLEPKDNTAAVGENFTVNITVTGITEEQSLYLWDCRINFNPGIIHAVDATEGPFLKTTGYDTTWLSPSINNTAGTIDVGAFLTFSAQWDGFPPHGAVDTGTLATVTFQVVGQGATELAFKEKKDTELNTILIVSGIQHVNPITHNAEGGFFRNAGAPISLDLISIALIAGIVVIGSVAVFYFWRKRR